MGDQAGDLIAIHEAFAEPVLCIDDAGATVAIGAVRSDVSADPFEGAGNTARRISFEVLARDIPDPDKAMQIRAKGGLERWSVIDVVPRADVGAWVLSVVRDMSGLDMAASITGRGTLTGSLQLTMPLAGSLAGEGTAQGSIHASIHLAGSLRGQGSLSGAFGNVLSLAGIAAGIGTVTATMQATVHLAGTLAGTGGVGGSLLATAYLAGVLGGVGGLTGDITLTAAGPPADSILSEDGLSFFITEDGLHYIAQE